MSYRLALRNAIALLFRTLPSFRGKSRISNKISQMLSDNSDSGSISVITMRGNYRMKVDIRNQLESGAFWTGEYDTRTIRHLGQALPKGACVLDIGANIGFWSIPLGQRLQKIGGHLYAIEPIPTNYERLEENIKLNELVGFVRPIERAVGETSGPIAFRLETGTGSRTGNAYAALSGNDHNTDMFACLMSTLDDIALELNLECCHLIKVDIEGGELGFLRGGREFLHKYHPLIYSELNYAFMRHRGWSYDDFRELAHSLGYYVMRSDGKVYSLATEPLPNRRYESVFLVPSDTEMERRFQQHFLRPS